jgi:hypothetical protein
MSSTTSDSTSRASHPRRRSIGAALALAGVAAASAFGITATAVDLTPRDERQQQASNFLLGDGSVRFVRGSLDASSL